MSTRAHLISEIFDLIELKNTLTSLEMEYRQLQRMTLADGSVEKVDVLIKDPQGREIGLKKTDKGNYQFIADCSGLSGSQLKQQTRFINTIKQKYAYNKVLNELKKQGFIIAEEEKLRENTIRLVARKWK